MKIQTNSNVPDYTYFAMSDVSPEYNPDTDTLTVYNGEGTRRSWGRPGVESTIVFRGRDLIAIHVGFHHKHRGGQGWHYFQQEKDSWQKVSWGSLSDKDRKKILARENKAPSWAKSPGKLRTERRTPSQNTITAYKLVKIVEGRFVSLYDQNTVYELNKRLADKAQSDHEGGYYAYPTIEGLKRSWGDKSLVPKECYEDVEKLALLEVELGGRTIEYGRKIAATYIKPLRLIETIEIEGATLNA